MKKLLFLALIILTGCSANKQWPKNQGSFEIIQTKYSIRYYSRGKFVWGQQFGIEYRNGECDDDVFWLHMISYIPEIKSLEGSKIEIKLKIGEETYHVDPKLFYVHTFPYNSKMQLLFLSDVILKEEFMDLLEAEPKVWLYISKESEKYFDIPYEEFKLDGLKEARKQAKEMCLQR